MFRTVLLLFIGLCPLVAATAVGWHTNGSGVIPDVTVVHDFDLTAGRNIRWRTPLTSAAASSPIVVGDLVILTEDPDIVVALKVADGSQVWRATVDLCEDADEAAAVREIARKAMAADKRTRKPLLQEASRILGVKKFGPGEFRWAQPTPVSDGEHIWVSLTNGMVACFDRDGTRRWRRDCGKALNGRTHYGKATGSPRLVGDRLIINGKRSIVGLDASTGEPAWTVPIPGKWGDGRPGTAAVWRSGNTDYLVFHDRRIVRASDGVVVNDERRGTGSEASPAIHGDRVLFTIGDDHSHGIQCLQAFDLSAAADTVTLTPAWEEPDRKAADIATFTRVTPLILGDTVIHPVARGKHTGLLLLDLADGSYRKPGVKIRWSARPHNWWPSPIAAGGVVVICDLVGNIYLLKPGTPWELLCHQQADCDIRATPTAAGDALFIRTAKELLCVAPASEGKAAADADPKAGASP